MPLGFLNRTEYEVILGSGYAKDGKGETFIPQAVGRGPLAYTIDLVAFHNDRLRGYLFQKLC